MFQTTPSKPPTPHYSFNSSNPSPHLLSTGWPSVNLLCLEGFGVESIVKYSVKSVLSTNKSTLSPLRYIITFKDIGHGSPQGSLSVVTYWDTRSESEYRRTEVSVKEKRERKANFGSCGVLLFRNPIY